MFDDDAAHFQNIVLSMPEPSRLFRAYEIAKTALMAWHEESIRTHAVDASWAQVGEVVVLKREAKNALAKLWSFHSAYLEAEEAAFRQVAVLLVTTDVALKIFGRASTPGSPAARLMKQSLQPSSWTRCRGAQSRPFAPWAAGMIPWWPSGTGDRKSTRRRPRAAVLPPSQLRPLSCKHARRLPPLHCWHGHRLRLAHRTARKSTT